MPTQIELVKELSADSSNWHKKYPWYSLGQLVNLSNKKHPDFRPAAQTAAIYFNDMQRVHWLLHEQAFNKNKILVELNVPISTEGMQLTPQPFPKREHVAPITAPNHLIAVAAVAENDAIASVSLPILHEDISEEEVIIHHEPSKLKEEDNTETVVDLKKVKDKEESIEPTKIYVQQPEAVKDDADRIEQVIVEEQITVDGNLVAEHNSNDDFEDNITNKKIAIADSLKSIAKAEENIKAALAYDEPMELSFEPYHTIDYFASQGIKMDAKIDDKLGKQLKSFTSWLKTMKRLPAIEETLGDTQIVLINDKSLESTNVVTEAMAAVLVKQGKNEQAIEIFKKLSLLHPEKSRYFVAQIQQIKN